MENKVIFLNHNGEPLINQYKPYLDSDGNYVIDPRKFYKGKALSELSLELYTEREIQEEIKKNTIHGVHSI